MGFNYINDEWILTTELNEWTKIWGCPIVIDVALGGDADVENVEEHHILTYEYVISHQGELVRNLLDSLFYDYSKMQKKYGYDDDEAQEYMPDISKPDDLISLIEPIGIHIIDVVRDGLCYVGFEFECSWDDEHGLGFMTFKTDVVAVGDGDCSFLTWIAEEDMEKNQSE